MSASTQNQALSGVLFLYREVLRLELPGLADLDRAKAVRGLPIVLSRDEVARVLSQLDPVSSLEASLLYGPGSGSRSA